MTPLRDGRRQVLVIEDDVTFRRALCEFIEDSGFSAVAASNGRDAIEWLQTNQIAPALILLDLNMAGVDGWRFREWQRSIPAFRSIPVIVVSGVPDAARSIGATAVLAKPVRPDAVLEYVERYAAV
jgi:CheY-like chemotaxis protein